MPFAKIEVEFLRDHFEPMPARDRSNAIALYLALVLHSSEMLSDGVITEPVLHAIADTIGLEPSRKTTRNRATSVRLLLGSGLLTGATNGPYLLTFWAEHHSSRDYVRGRRNADAERKRTSREQLTLNDVTTNVRSGQTGMSAAESERTSRAHMRAGGQRTEQERKTSAVDLGENGAAEANVHSTGLDRLTFPPPAPATAPAEDDPEPVL